MADIEIGGMVAMHPDTVNGLFAFGILLLRKWIYHTLHFFIGFIGLPTGQPKSVENSCMLEKGPCTRNISGA